MPRGSSNAKLQRRNLGQVNLNASLRALAGSQGVVPVRTGRRPGVGAPERVFPLPPDGWKGTLPEWAIYWAHLQLKLKPDQDFIYIYNFGTGGDESTQVDFYELGFNLAIEIQGMFWHYGFGHMKEQNDIARRGTLESMGLVVVFIDEDDALRAPLYFLKEALAGRDHSLSATGIL